MASPIPVAAGESDGYIPMSPVSFLNTNSKTDTPPTLSPLICQPRDFAPPPIHRHLKPCMRRGESHNRPDSFVLYFWHCKEP